MDTTEHIHTYFIGVNVIWQRIELDFLYLFCKIDQNDLTGPQVGQEKKGKTP